MIQPAASPETRAPDPFEARAQRHGRMLAELAEIGMEIARALKTRALSQDEAVDPGEVGLAFSRVAKAVRQSLMLEEKLAQDRQASVAAAEALAAQQREQAAQIAEDRQVEGFERKTQVRDIVEEVIEEVHDGRDHERLRDALHEHLEGLEDEADLLDRPISQTVSAICEALNLTPDWSFWQDQDWALDEAEDDVKGSPYAERSERRLTPPWERVSGERVSGERARGPEPGGGNSRGIHTEHHPPP
jgi:hypothetical protein